MYGTQQTPNTNDGRRASRVKSALAWLLLIVAAVFPFPFWP
jgi:hypothetical protein